MYQKIGGTISLPSENFIDHEINFFYFNFRINAG